MGNGYTQSLHLDTSIGTNDSPQEQPTVSGYDKISILH